MERDTRVELARPAVLRTARTRFAGVALSSSVPGLRSLALALPQTPRRAFDPATPNQEGPASRVCECIANGAGHEGRTRATGGAAHRQDPLRGGRAFEFCSGAPLAGARSAPNPASRVRPSNA